MSNPIQLTEKDIQYIKSHKKRLGYGVDGEVYHVGNNVLYKLYNPNRPFSPAQDGVLTRTEALYRALELQKRIKLSHLPQNIIYMNGQVIGCTYKKYNTILGIYAACMFPIPKRKEICQSLFIKIQELLEHNIYPVTLAQKNDLFPILKKDSNVLLSYRLEPLLIDLDGISAKYTNHFINSCYIEALSSITKLIFEILLGQNLTYEYLEENREEFARLAYDAGIDPDIADIFYRYNYLDIDTINKVLKR